MIVAAISISVLDWIIYTVQFTTFIVFATLALAHRRLPPSLKWFCLVLLLHLVSGLSAIALYRLNINPNYAASVFYIVVPLAYLKFFQRTNFLGKWSAWFLVWTLLHVVLSTANLLFVQKATLNTYSDISMSLIIITLCLMFYFRLLRNPPGENLLSDPIFWFVTATFIARIGQMLMVSFVHFLINIFNDNLITLFVLHHGLALACDLLIVYGAWLAFVSKDRSVN